MLHVCCTDLEKMPLTCDNPCSPAWTRTRNPSVNSRMLCQLSYGGLPFSAHVVGADRWMTLAYWRTDAQAD
jgi:hypothetical protein